jgi:serine O-acetyltransferase
MEYIPITTPSGRVWSTLQLTELARYVERQVKAFFPDQRPVPLSDLEAASDRALAAIARGWKFIALSGYSRDGEGSLSHLYGDQYASFLALLARELSIAQAGELATRVYLLNKALHGFDLFHEVALPEVFVFVHPVGTVIGRAKLGNFLCIYQNCAIGGNPREGRLDYPTLGDGVLMYAMSSIIGNSKIGNRVVLGAGSAVINEDVPDDSLVAGTAIKPARERAATLLARIFRGMPQ